MLRFTCGSVDGGKSTLIGRLLYDSKMIFDDQLSALEAASKNPAQGDAIDFALLVDELAPPSASRASPLMSPIVFATEKRKFIVADTPGHEQYTRNMVTGVNRRFGGAAGRCAPDCADANPPPCLFGAFIGH